MSLFYKNDKEEDNPYPNISNIKQDNSNKNKNNRKFYKIQIIKIIHLNQPIISRIKIISEILCS